MVSSLIEPQYHDGKFWKFSKSSAAGSSNNFDVPVVPSFAADFEVGIKTNRNQIAHENQIINIIVCSFPWN